MRNAVKTNIMFIICTFFLFQCSSGIEHDAHELAKLHHQKTALVLELLATNDSATTTINLSKIDLLEYEFQKLKNRCQLKYADSLQKAAFAKAYKEALIKYK